jgi:hypothetical protein
MVQIIPAICYIVGWSERACGNISPGICQWSLQLLFFSRRQTPGTDPSKCGVAHCWDEADMKNALSRIALVVLVLLVGAELAVRLSGMVDFPIYHVDNEIGYIPEPNQAGTFLHKNSWVFNDRSMGTAAPWSPTRPGILLIGNSIVMGGNVYDQKEKLGPLLQQQMGDSYVVWPIAAGGWTNVNELAYLKRNAVVTANPRFFLWEFMTGGLSGPSVWQSDLTWPREHPTWASWYVFRRYIWPRLYHSLPSELPPVGATDAAYLAEFKKAIAALARATGKAHSGILFLYPSKAQYLVARQGQKWLPERSEIESVASTAGLTVIDIAQQREWNESLYRADGVHPTVRGNQVLALILANSVKQTIQ